MIKIVPQVDPVLQVELLGHVIPVAGSLHRRGRGQEQLLVAYLAVLTAVAGQEGDDLEVAKGAPLASHEHGVLTRPKLGQDQAPASGVPIRFGEERGNRRSTQVHDLGRRRIERARVGGLHQKSQHAWLRAPSDGHLDLAGLVRTGDAEVQRSQDVARQQGSILESLDLRGEPLCSASRVPTQFLANPPKLPTPRNPCCFSHCLTPYHQEIC